MSEVTALFGISLALIIGAMSPGPSFLIVAQTAAASGRNAGLITSFGMGVGSLVFATAAILGIGVLFVAVPFVYILLKIVGGAYLIYLGFRILRSAKQNLKDKILPDGSEKQLRRKYFSYGLTTQLSNPKTAIVYGSIFAALLPSDPSLGFKAVVLLSVFIIESGWYSLVAVALSTSKWRVGYLNYKKWIDRSAGAVMAILGIKLVSTATTV